MKRTVKFLVVVLLLAGVSFAGSVFVSCASSSDGAVMRPTRYHNNRVIKSNYKVKGSNRTFSSNYIYHAD